MKKLMLSMMASVAMLTGCATTGTDGTTNAINTATNAGMAVFKNAVDIQCRTQLNGYNAYKTITMLMPAEQKTALENKVCGCVSEKASQSVTLAELGQAVIDENARVQIATSAVSKTINACVSEFAGGI
ncbi:hypothetical protein [Moraxella lacunata]|uniref:Lipoprotein n=1 Tax=Moraxella lacunata TaxID=477 RepID=A0A1V4H426_MORLA|nr:hypothetical protein [Moraxella lacunata]OPH39358.1 hypothetical protein B5J94_00845 [Moraxella lacunata]